MTSDSGMPITAFSLSISRISPIGSPTDSCRPTLASSFLTTPFIGAVTVQREYWSWAFS
ncbi:MAG: hypothetical protein ACD_75C00345G0001 [uncultured bacterium]|nr:MAG: hypothetical protein ACD_75C00345G0001 [uncultured bacterium]